MTAAIRRFVLAGATLKRARQAADLTQQQAAAIVDRSLRWWVGIERGESASDPIIIAEWHRRVRRMKRKPKEPTP